MANTTERLQSDEMAMLHTDPLLARWSLSLFRDIFGNPFRHHTVLPLWSAWNDGIVPRIAGDIYEGRCFADLPILADALEDAGCDETAMLSHLRGPGPHVRGCWALDLVLGKE